MRRMLIFIILLMIYQDDGGGSPSSYRRYQQVMIPPYHPTESIQATFQFANTFADDITLTWRISNQKFFRTLIYTQAFSPRNLIQRTISLPAHLFDGAVSTLHLQARRANFESSVDLKVYPQTNYDVAHFSQPFYSSHTISRIDSFGFIIYEREHFHFEGMTGLQSYPVYGRLDLSSIRIRMLAKVATDIVFSNAHLLIADHVDLEGLPLNDAGYRQLTLNPRLVGDRIDLRFPPLYVHPKTLVPSSIPLQDYVATNFLFFPMRAFEDLRQHGLRLQLQIRHFHTMSFTYEFTYVANKAIFGSCFQSQTCIQIYG
jgi:hypothetical protein